MSWLKSLTSISRRRDVRVLVTRLFKYSLVPRNLRRVRAGRTTRSAGGGEMPMWLGRDVGERKWSERL